MGLATVLVEVCPPVTLAGIPFLSEAIVNVSMPDDLFTPEVWANDQTERLYADTPQNRSGDLSRLPDVIAHDGGHQIRKSGP